MSRANEGLMEPRPIAPAPSGFALGGMSGWTKPIVVISWLAAAGLEAWLASAGRPGRFAFIVASFALAYGIARALPSVSSALVFLAYVAPALIALATGVFYVGDYALWWAPFAGTVLSGQRLTRWHVSGRWRDAIALWASSVALSWPVVALREVDWNLAYVFGGRASGSGAFNQFVGAWIASVAAVLLLGVLWFDYLCGLKDQPRRIYPRVIWPMAWGALIALPVAIYQGWMDVGFLSGGAWPSLNRAAGTMQDANAFGMVCAFWGLGWIALSREFPRARPYAWAIYASSWMAIWATGSRTALLAALVGLPGLAVGNRLLTRRRVLGGIVLVLAALTALQLLKPGASPVSRISENFPDWSRRSVVSGLQSLWTRADYGTASTRMIGDYPLSGVGIGMFSTLLPDYLAESGRPSQPPDNAQNWYRHQLAETGVLGSLGWIVFALLLVPVLNRARKSATAAPLVFALLGFSVASMLGMPAQNLAVTLTFWTFVAWVIPDDLAARDAPRRRLMPAALAAVLCLFLVHTIVVARGDLRPAFRAARFGYDYTYGFHFDTPDLTWTDRHAVGVLKAPTQWMKLTVWVADPAAAQKPMHVDVWKDHEHVVNHDLLRNVPLTQYVPVPGDNKRFVLETKVPTTFKPGVGDDRELGLALKWEFVDAPPR